MKKRIFYYAAAALFFLFSSCAPKMREGDIIFHSSGSPQSRAIQLATRSKYSHMGILFKKNGSWHVLEALETVRHTPLHLWIRRAEGSRYTVKRLKNAKKLLNENAIEKMREKGELFLGRPYDYAFEWSDERLYCSELVWKIYKSVLDIEIGEPADAGSFDFSSEEVKRLLKESFGDDISGYKDKIISPGAVFDSVLLKKVIEK